MENILGETESEPEWIEMQAIPELGFRVWHIMFFCFSILLVLIILICCCVKIRIPRTKQEIEADYQRKKIAKKFRQRLHLIQNTDLDNMDLKLAMERVQEDFENENRKLMEDLNGARMKAEPQQPIILDSTRKKLSMLMIFSNKKNTSNTTDTQSQSNDTNLNI